MWLKLFQLKLTGTQNEELNLADLFSRKISLDEEFNELALTLKKVDKEYIKLKNEREFWELTKSNHEAMNHMDFNMKEKEVNSLISKTVKSMISNLFEDHSFLVEKRQIIKRHKSISQSLMRNCKKYIDLSPHANIASKSCILSDIQQSMEELEQCEKELSQYDTTHWKAPITENLHLQKTP